MIDQLPSVLSEHRESIYLLFRRYADLDKRVLVGPDLAYEYEQFCLTEAGQTLADTRLTQIIRSTQEAVLVPPLIYLAVRLSVAKWRWVQIHVEQMVCREVTVSEYLTFKERLVERSRGERWVLELDLSPFERGFPKLSETRSIGRGVEYLNRFLSGRLFDSGGEGHRRLFEFLKLHQVQGRQLMLNGVIREVADLREALRLALDHMQTAPPDAVWEDQSAELRKLGFEVGWGRTVPQIREMMELLSDILEAPAPRNLEQFLSRIPMIFTIAIVSPHGFFGQSEVLGKPDTGGQVVYILDQVRALEREMRNSIHDQGLDFEPQILVLTRLIPESQGTTSDQRLEHILGTEHARILRVPFRDVRGRVVPQWIRRFEIWEYLERYAVESEREVVAELGGKPDFLIGNYSDGNLVASILAHRLGVTQCNIAHALEKTKYPHSDLHWKQHEDEYHFSCQYTADLIAMNTADFIITSTYQEIAGTKESVGQYESYSSFTMPGLYRVVSGIDCFDPKFNIVSPGTDEAAFFPYYEIARRPPDLRTGVLDLMLGNPGDNARGQFRDPNKPILFAMSRLDRVKNMAGLLEWYARSAELRAVANLFLVGGQVDPERATGAEQLREIHLMHGIFDEFHLDEEVRWVLRQTDKTRVGELYRCVADSRGAFVQPALFEAFGLTVIEALRSGLPTFATCYGGPLEIIEDGVSGFHIDPNHGESVTRRIIEFFEAHAQDPEYWWRISQAGVLRVQTRYTWQLYAKKLLSLSRIYGFWNYITNIERQETRRYLEMFYGLMYRPLARGTQQRALEKENTAE
jgi:sucrose synthase